MPWGVMTRRRPCPAAPGPLERHHAARFDDLFGSLAQRRGFREYLAGLLAPRDRNKTLCALPQGVRIQRQRRRVENQPGPGRYRALS